MWVAPRFHPILFKFDCLDIALQTTSKTCIVDDDERARKVIERLGGLAKFAVFRRSSLQARYDDESLDLMIQIGLQEGVIIPDRHAAI